MLTRADVDDVGIRLGHGDGADGTESKLTVRDVLPGKARIIGLPHTAARVASVEDHWLRWGCRQSPGTTATERADAPPLSAAKELLSKVERAGAGSGFWAAATTGIATSASRARRRSILGGVMGARSVAHARTTVKAVDSSRSVTAASWIETKYGTVVRTTNRAAIDSMVASRPRLADARRRTRERRASRDRRDGIRRWRPSAVLCPRAQTRCGELVSHALNAGATGVIIPNVDTVRQAEESVRCVLGSRWPLARIVVRAESVEAVRNIGVS